MIKKDHFYLVLVAALAFVVEPAVAQNAPKASGVSVAPDEWLLFGSGKPWWYQSQPSPTSSTLQTRPPTRDEQPIVDRARDLANRHPVRALALLEGDSVVYLEYKAPADADSMLFGLSMGKTVTAMAVGQAICSGKLKFETKADDLVPQLKGTALGQVTVRDLLRMASGTEPLADSTIWTPEQFNRWNQGKLTILESVTEARVSKAARGIFSDYKPGEYFYYKSTDPMVLGLMVTRATGMPFSYWVQETILNPMGAAKTGFIVQDREADAASDAGIRLRMEDWIRFAQWVQRSSKASGCFGDFVRAATSTQISNPGPPTARKSGQESFDGYGYLIWTENRTAPNTAWALGHAGQSISWHKDSNRMVVMFSNVYPGTQELVRDWNRLGR